MPDYRAKSMAFVSRKNDFQQFMISRRHVINKGNGPEYFFPVSLNYLGKGLEKQQKSLKSGE